MNINEEIMRKIVYIEDVGSNFFLLFQEVLRKIPDSDKVIILRNLGRVSAHHFGRLTEEECRAFNISKGEAGATSKFDDETGCHCIVRVDLSRPDNVIREAIAHELAHVLLNHPCVNCDGVSAEKGVNNILESWGINNSY
jgi:hypothetical protein